MIKVINNVINKKDCFGLYDELTTQHMWKLNRFSNDGDLGGRFPGVNLIENFETIHNHPYWIGYFSCLFDRINQLLFEQHNFLIKKNIFRIALNAANDNAYTEFHADHDSNYYTIVGFLTPQWAEQWGGELNVMGNIYKYNPGDFVMLDSSYPHKSQEIKKIPYWRISVAYVVKKP